MAPLLLTRELDSWPALRMQDLGDRTGTFVGMTAACALCAWLPPGWLRRRSLRRAASPPSAS